MKTKPFVLVAGLTVVVACLTTLTSTANAAPRVGELKKELGRVPVPEMPAKAAQLVQTANSDERESVAIAVVLAAVDLKPAAAAAVVGAIAKSTPEVAATVAATAVMRQPKQIVAITKAAVSAAPSQVGKIVAAVCKQAPTKYNLIADAAHQAAPEANKEILEAIKLVVPDTKLAASVVLTPAPPDVGGPFTPVSGSPTEINRNNTAEVAPGGGRNYSGP